MLKDLRKRLPELEKDALLEWVGLEGRRSVSERVVTSLAIFGAGVLVGAGLGLMLAPKPGRDLRSDLRHRLKKGGASESAAQPEATPESRQG